MKKGVYAARLQALTLIQKLNKRTKDDVINELQQEIKGYEEIYGSTFEEAFKDVENPDVLDEPDDFFDWCDAIKELEQLLRGNKKETSSYNQKGEIKNE